MMGVLLRDLTAWALVCSPHGSLPLVTAVRVVLNPRFALFRGVALQLRTGRAAPHSMHAAHQQQQDEGGST